MRKPGTMASVRKRFLIHPDRVNFGVGVGVGCFSALGASFGRGIPEGLPQGWQSSEASSDKAEQRQTFGCWLFQEEPLASPKALLSEKRM